MKTITAKGLSAILLAALLLLLPGTGKEACAADPASDSADTMEPVDTTVMIYMCGSDLESRFGITRSTASKVVSLMAQKGLVEQLSVEGDRRKKQLRLTRKAREVTQMMNEDRRHFEQMLRRGFSTEELEMLFSFLDRLHANLSEKEENEEQEAL